MDKWSEVVLAIVTGTIGLIGWGYKRRRNRKRAEEEVIREIKDSCADIQNGAARFHRIVRDPGGAVDRVLDSSATANPD